jgi:hypothetical protein
MQKHPRGHRGARPGPTQRELFTGGKTAQLAIFNNMAFTRIAGLLNHLRQKPHTDDKDVLEQVFKKWLGDNPTKKPENDVIFHKLRDYLWKGYRDHRNSSGHILTDGDRSLVVDMLRVLEPIRNFHSHIWHDNNVLRVSPELAKHIQYLHDMAKLSLMKDHGDEIVEYEKNAQKFPLFRVHSSGDYLTFEGRLFFLSFFLTHGEMSRLLHQSRGSKRDDKPEFKIKHRIFKYYAHRDGAARQHYGYEEGALSKMEVAERNDVLNMRQAYKIVSYLNDLPPVLSDTKLFPLFVEGRPVQNAEDLIAFCHANDLLSDLNMRVLVIPARKDKDGKLIPETIKEQIIVIDYKGYKVELSQHTLHRLLLDRVLTDRLALGDVLDGNPPESVADHEKPRLRKPYQLNPQLDAFIAEREYLLDLIENNDFRVAENENTRITINNELDEYYRYKLRGGDSLKQKMGQWLERLQAPDQDKRTQAFDDFRDAIRDRPIEVDYYDFFFEADEKPRAEDHFVRYAVQYLIDMDICPDWHWAYERFEVRTEQKEKEIFGKKVKVPQLVNKRCVNYFSSTPFHADRGALMPESPWRLALTDDHQILVGIYTNEPADWQAEGRAPQFKFLLGHRAVVNLLMAHMEGKEIKSFLPDLVGDLQKARKGQHEYQILTAHELPTAYRVAMRTTEPPTRNQLLEEAQDRIEVLKKMLHPFEKNQFADLRLRRADKNRQIMRCYTYFDWKYPHQEAFKFLRQDEYQRMTVFHYCLEKRRAGTSLDKGKYAFLLDGIEKHLPDKLAKVLQDSKDLDTLLCEVAKITVIQLDKIKAELPKAQTAKFRELLGKIGISTRQEKAFPPNTLPFDVHPLLPLRAFFPEDLLTVNVPYTDKKKPRYAAYKLRNNKSNQSGLRTAFYNNPLFFEPYNVGPNAKAVKKRIIGAMDDLLTHDILLWHMAKKYLAAVSPAYQAYITGNRKIDWKVNYLRQTEIPIQLGKEHSRFNKVTLKLKFHQLDDYLLFESLPFIGRTAWQAIRRYEDGTYAPDNMGIEVIKPGESYIITYDEVFKEMQRIRQESLCWAKCLLDWEKRIIDGTSDAKCNELARSNSGREHIKFNQVLDQAGITDAALRKQLSHVRGITLHAQVSNDILYWELENDSVFCATIGYTPVVKRNYYVAQDEKNDANAQQP